jgi:hypothetical protein
MIKNIVVGLLIAGLVLTGAGAVVFAQTENAPVCPPENNITDVLGLSTGEIRDAYRLGKTLEDLFDAQGLDYDAYIAELTENSLACVVDALANGDITEEQATRLKDAIQNFSDKGFSFGFKLRSFRNSRLNELKSGSLENLAEVLGMETTELVNAFKDGSTLSQIAELQGVDQAVVFEEWIKSQIADINQAVDDGKLDSERAATLVERLNTKLSEGFDFENWNPFDKPLEQRARLSIIAGKDLVNTVLDAMDMTVEDLRSALLGGQTIEELAVDNGVDLDALYQTWLEEQISKVNEKLASEAITQQQADILLEKLNNQLGEPFPSEFLRNLKSGMEKLRDNRSNGWSRPGRMSGHGDLGSSQQEHLVDGAELNF